MNSFDDELKSILRSAIAITDFSTISSTWVWVAVSRSQKRAVRSLLRRLNRQIEQVNNPDVIFTDIYQIRRGNR